MRIATTFVRDKLLAALIALGVYYLQTISSELKELGKTLAVAVVTVDQHERRISILERNEQARPRRDRP